MSADLNVAPRRRPSLWGPGLVCLTAALIAGCKKDASTGGSERTVPWLEGGLIHYPQAFAEREQLAVAVVESGPVTPTVEVTGITPNARQAPPWRPHEGLRRVAAEGDSQTPARRQSSSKR
jgi:hypothetical protein